MKKTCSYCEKYKAIHAPRNGCKRCWYFYFQQNPYQVKGAIFTAETFGMEKAEAVYGSVFMKFFTMLAQETFLPSVQGNPNETLR